ncbi:MAG: peroxide stress protein YaaA [Bacteroidales bacterium]|nr:peroxide stress protein YaaA [Bacteroidales bacterium]
MLIVISPAKTLNFEQQAVTNHFTQNEFLPKSEKLIKELKKYSAKDLMKLMNISDSLAHLNRERFANWMLPFDSTNAKQALFAFKGDVYTGLDADLFNEKEILFTQNHLRILSGLYGVLRPLDLIQAYRLEMGTKLITKNQKSLYGFWGNSLTKKINEALKAQSDSILVNLASNEYFKALDKTKLKAEIITPVFKDFKNGEYKTISFYAKKARGLMSRFILKNELTGVDELKNFEMDGYFYSDIESSTNQLVFLRG